MSISSVSSSDQAQMLALLQAEQAQAQANDAAQQQQASQPSVFSPNS